MPRRPRFVEPGLAHHITQRGNNRQDVFESSADRQCYVKLLLDHLDHHRIRVLAWCLMTNHVHLIAVPDAKESLGLALGQAHSQYSLAWNRARGRVGHLWQNRFFSCPLDASRVLATMRYVDRNPARASMVRNAWEWPWSSAAAHVGAAMADPLLAPDWKEWTLGAGFGEWDAQRWAESLGAQQEDQALAIRRATVTGEPLGPEEFLERLESEAGHRLRVLKRGRPAKAMASSVGQGAILD
jgi:putative transposase